MTVPYNLMVNLGMTLVVFYIEFPVLSVKLMNARAL